LTRAPAGGSLGASPAPGVVSRRPGPGAIAPALVLLVSVGACRPAIYDIDRIADPVQKARYSCQYLLERALAREDQKDADGVLRRRLADFAEPRVGTVGDFVEVSWPADTIVLREDGSRHRGGCTLRLRPQGRWVQAVTLDDQNLHAGFGM
jgi:hypothetical protein